MSMKMHESRKVPDQMNKIAYWVEERNDETKRSDLVTVFAVAAAVCMRSRPQPNTYALFAVLRE